MTRLCPRKITFSELLRRHAHSLQHRRLGLKMPQTLWSILIQKKFIAALIGNNIWMLKIHLKQFFVGIFPSLIASLLSLTLNKHKQSHIRHKTLWGHLEHRQRKYDLESIIQCKGSDTHTEHSTQQWLSTKTSILGRL